MPGYGNQTMQVAWGVDLRRPRAGENRAAVGAANWALGKNHVPAKSLVGLPRRPRHGQLKASAARTSRGIALSY